MKKSRLSLGDYLHESLGVGDGPSGFYELSSFDLLDMDQLRVEFMRMSPSYAFVSNSPGAGASPLKAFSGIFPIDEAGQGDSKVSHVTSENLKPRLKAIKEAHKEYGDINVPIGDWYKHRGRHIFDNWTNRRDVNFLGVSNFEGDKNLNNPAVKAQAVEYINMITTDENWPKTMLLAIPFDLPKATAMKHVQILIEAHYDWILKIKDVSYRQRKPLATLRERPDALVRKLKVMICKAFHPDMPLWKVGLLSGISPKHQLRFQDKSLDSRDKVFLRPEIATLTSRALRQGQYIAEHAAMDIFPVSETIPIPQYDWDALKTRILLAYPYLKVSDVFDESQS